jgi:uncharacterized phage-associated protein
MLATHEREKLINAVIYFARNTRFCGKTKLFKLLYFADFEHFKALGRSVTGLNYFAWKMGPVPVELHEEIEQPERDMADAVQFEERPVKNGTMLLIKPRREFDARHFTKRELAILDRLATEYRSATAEDMIESTHLENRPWHRVYEQEGRRQQQIPYEYAVNQQEADLLEGLISERREILRHYSRG